MSTTELEAAVDAATAFEEHRPLLLGVAYRMLGSMWDAEDIVQDAYTRWARNADTVREPRAFLLTVVTRIALDHLKSARVAREAYVGPWLPEPVATNALGPMDTAELRDTVAYATVHLMERLSPPERAVFVLREAFELPYERIAEILGNSVANCRQLHSRGRRRLGDSRRFPPAPQTYARLLRTFLAAAETGDLADLGRVLSDDITVWNDGGGKVRAALRPVSGLDRVMPFLAGLLAHRVFDPGPTVEVNGQPAGMLYVAGEPRVCALHVRTDRITGIYVVNNPDKLHHLPTVTAAEPTRAGVPGAGRGPGRR
jgi:RNA polymerase sigma-70 factor, ECF subfamily